MFKDDWLSLAKKSIFKFGLLSDSFNSIFLIAISLWSFAIKIFIFFSADDFKISSIFVGTLNLTGGKVKLLGIDLKLVILLNLDIDFFKFPSAKISS